MAGASPSKARCTISRTPAGKLRTLILHMPIRKSETLPAAQQVNASQLDVLLFEIGRITQ